MNKIIEQIKDAEKIINSIDFDAHWYRRVFHVFGASFLVYYILPDVDWINLIKFWFPISIVTIALIVEILRLRGLISSEHFFGLRFYEKNRIGSYMYFAIAVVILLEFFPQKIAIPCILCACIVDPLMGEIRHRYNEKISQIVGLLTCVFLFSIVWYESDPIIVLSVSVIGGFGALIGEVRKLKWLDDDFMIQILPAILVLIFCIISIKITGVNILDGQVIYPVEVFW